MGMMKNLLYVNFSLKKKILKKRDLKTENRNASYEGLADSLAWHSGSMFLMYYFASNT